MDILAFEKSAKSFASLNYAIPAIQRELKEEIAEIIYNKENAAYEAYGKYLIPGTVSFCLVKSDGVEYLIDGQHRMRAYSRLSADFPEREILINIDHYTCATMENLDNIYKIVNTSTPNEISRMSVSTYKLKQEIAEFFKQKFSQYLKPTAKPRAPNINLDVLLSKLDAPELDKFQLGEFPRLALELNKFYAQTTPLQFAAWKVDKKHIELVQQYPNQLFLGVYRDYEWVDRIFLLREMREFDPKTTFSDMGHGNTAVRLQITRKLKIAVWNSGKMQQPCYCCGDTISYDTFQCGHIIPVCRGGKTVAENLKAICSTCNSDMGTKNLEDYKRLISDQVN